MLLNFNFSVIFFSGDKRAVGAVAALIGATLAAAANLATVVSTYNELQHKPKILVKINNYSKWTLTVNPIKQIEGVINRGFPILYPGEEDGWAASKEESLDTGSTEGFAVLKFPKRVYCVIYWRVGQMDGGERTPNALGIGCGTKISEVEDWQRIINRSLKTRCDLDNFYYQEYANTHSINQFCNDDVCVQGTLFSAFEGEARVEIVPRNATRVAPSLVSKMRQKTIDRIFIPHEPGCIDGGAAVALNTKLAILMAVLYALLR